MTRYLDGPVAIIGAGIGGLTAALSLQHFGVPVRVFEQARALREIGAGVTITPNAMSAHSPRVGALVGFSVQFTISACCPAESPAR